MLIKPLCGWARAPTSDFIEVDDWSLYPITNSDFGLKGCEHLFEINLIPLDFTEELDQLSEAILCF